MNVTTREATPEDAAAMVRILNGIIEIGGTTAHETPLSREAVAARYITGEDVIACTVAILEDEDDSAKRVVGFQYLGWPTDPDDLPPRWAEIASFVDPGLAGKGIGRRLFAATVRAAELAGIDTIDATIRADNVGGLAYYGGLGFKPYDQIDAVPLQDGTKVNRIRKRFDM